MLLVGVRSEVRQLTLLGAKCRPLISLGSLVALYTMVQVSLKGRLWQNVAK